MSEAGQLFRRSGVHGWLILSGGIPSFGGEHAELASRLLGLLDLARPPLALYAEHKVSGALAEFLEEIELLLGVDFEHVSISEASRELVESAGLILLADAGPEAWVDAIAGGPGPDRFSPDWLIEGSVLLLVGSAAAAAGTWMYQESQDMLLEGLNWLPGSIILMEDVDPAATQLTERLLSEEAPVYALGLPEGAILAVGPGAEVEVWSGEAPRIILGKAWRQA